MELLKEHVIRQYQQDQEKREGFKVDPQQFQLDVPDYWKNLAEKGFGQEYVREGMIPAVNMAQNQYMNTMGQIQSGFGKRGMYDSSLREQASASALGQRQSIISGTESKLLKQNQQVMMEGQRVLEQIRQFNQGNFMQGELYNKQLGFDLYSLDRNLQMQQKQLQEQRRAADWSMMSGFMSLIPVPFM